MDSLSFAVVSTFTVALLHTAIPSHWLCFVAVAKAQGWRRRQVLAVAALAGVVHVVMTVTFGVVARVLGRQILSEQAFERGAGFILMALGASYLVFHFANAGHHHASDAARRVPDRWAIGGLVMAVTISPCTAAIPFLVAAAGHGVVGVLLVSGVLLVTTVGMMMLLVGLTSLGAERLQFRHFDRYEKLILGLLLAGLGAGVLLLGGGHSHA
ncbi:MAG: hypothetical protein HYY16_00420 [Planctomycetes bacterium]|nr:hypothetical protein [Planctomycetota bacterium]